ncbi:AAA domain-containing protein [Brevibacillus sp. SYP-B805]|uniref:McrB family protein n=1 Tax=Brevibacillus sp. SYP-B805 TaxID=1578199 RepID=UPI0013ED3678|nr:AAA family ATPase [Brevibacillus sp. SYP-B805]NGQ97509.1 AAA domain-containing protein [Brevibacillus sp. SYP-B805]
MKRLKKWDMDLIGALATDEEAYEYQGRSRSIFRNSQNYLQFYIKLLSAEPPYSLPRDRKLFTCYSSDLEKYGFQDDFSNSDLESRIENLKDFLNDSLIVFQPYLKVLPNHDEVYVASEIRLVPKLDTYKTDQMFMTVPVFSKEVHDINQNEFELNLLNRKFLGRIDNISKELDDTPTIVLWKENEQDYFMYGPFNKHDYAHGGLILLADQPFKKCLFTWLHKAYYMGKRDTVIFIDVETYTRMQDELEKQIPYEEMVNTEDYDEIMETNIDVKTEQEVAPDKASQKPAAGSIDENRPTKEDEFMEAFLRETREMGLVYKEKDLYNFHTAMKSNSLTILAGMSGTGKSKLVQAYGKALGLDASQLVFIPVRPSWTDDSDLLGYVDIKNMIYRPGDSGLVDALNQAQRQDRKLYIICFDEMNLARVEHYFSQFLSVLEMEPSRRTLRLYSGNIEQQVYNSATYSPEIQIGNNVIFVGTVNLDESTYHFSDKVLDRANVITLEVEPFVKLQQIERKGHKQQPKEPITFEEYNQFRKSEDSSMSLTSDELNFLWEMHLIMQTENKNLGVGPRVVKQIDLYLKNLPQNPFLSREEAFDLQIVQRVLTKLRGPEGLLKSLVGKLVEDKPNGSIYALLEKHEGISKFTKSKQVLIQKAKELKVNGFTI